MNMFQNFKRVQAIRPQVLDGASATSYVIDLAGATECNIVLSVGATDAAITALKLQESDTKTDATTLATGTDCTGLVFGTSADPLTGSTSVTPTATSDGYAYCLSFNTKNRKRFVQLVATAENTTVGAALSADAFLLLEQGPKSTSDRGYDGMLTA